MDEIKQNENEPLEHYELRYLLQEAKAIVLPMTPDQQRKWVAESRIAQEIYAILVQHPEYYEEFRVLVGGFFPEPKSYRPTQRFAIRVTEIHHITLGL